MPYLKDWLEHKGKRPIDIANDSNLSIKTVYRTIREGAKTLKALQEFASALGVEPWRLLRKPDLRVGDALSDETELTQLLVIGEVGEVGREIVRTAWFVKTPFSEQWFVDGAYGWVLQEEYFGGYRRGDMFVVDPTHKGAPGDLIIAIPPGKEIAEMYRLKLSSGLMTADKDNPQFAPLEGGWAEMGVITALLYRSKDNL